MYGVWVILGRCLGDDTRNTNAGTDAARFGWRFAANMPGRRPMSHTSRRHGARPPTSSLSEGPELEQIKALSANFEARQCVTFGAHVFVPVRDN